MRADDRRPLRYRISSLCGRVYIRTFFGAEFRIEGEEHVAREGPVLVVCNHLSNLDPIIFGGFFPHTLFAMAKRELYRLPLAAWWLAGCNCIPVDRGASDRRAVTSALEVMRRRGRLLVFIEGTRSPTAAMQRAEPGAGFLARRGGAMVQPVAIWGTEVAGRVRVPFRRRTRITLRYGVPYRPALQGRHDDAAIADEMGAAVARLLPARYRGHYAADASA